MPVRKDIPYNEGLFFITFTCYKWLPLIEQTNGYDLVYNWFDYLKKQNHRIAGYVIMPNHVHALIDFTRTTKKINTVIGDGKRFMAYEIIKRLKEAGQTDVLALLEKAVTAKSKDKGKNHEVWEESFDWKICETIEFTYQKLMYMPGCTECSVKKEIVTVSLSLWHSHPFGTTQAFILLSNQLRQIIF